MTIQSRRVRWSGKNGTHWKDEKFTQKFGRKTFWECRLSHGSFSISVIIAVRHADGHYSKTQIGSFAILCRSPKQLKYSRDG